MLCPELSVFSENMFRHTPNCLGDLRDSTDMHAEKSCSRALFPDILNIISIAERSGSGLVVTGD